MIFAIPIVGKILAGFAASETSVGAPTTQKAGQPNIQAIGASAANPTDFAQALNSVDQAASKASHSVFDSAKV
jgi:hypothetical protein